MKKLFLIYFLFVLTGTAVAQVKVSSSVDRREIRIGEPVLMNIEAIYSSNLPLQWFDIPDTFNTLEISKREKIDTTAMNGGFVLKQQLIITGFDSGRWVIPQFHLILDGRNYSTDSFSITVNPVALEGTDYKDLKEIEEADEVKDNKLLWWIIGGAVLLLLLLIWFFTRKKKKPVSEKIILGGGYEEALKQLQQLKKESLTEKGEVVLYYTRLTDIFRNYLLRDKGIRSMEKTSVEILAELKKTTLDTGMITEISIALRRCDFVKFAKYNPGNNEHADTIHTIEQTIKTLHR